MENSNSVLTSVKKLLGIEESCEDFDMDIVINVNSAIETLRQLGVSIQDGYEIESKADTYEDLLGQDINLANQVKMYLYCKTRLVFDPPSNSYLVDALKSTISELEFRINVRVDPRSTSENEGGENSK